LKKNGSFLTRSDRYVKRTRRPIEFVMDPICEL
jgi:hypothetical protein